MHSTSTLSAAEFDTMVEAGAFDCLGPRRVEYIRGEIVSMSPAGPIHDDFITYLTRWSTDSATSKQASVLVQGGFVCEENRPEPDVLWLQPRRYGRTRPTAADVMLLIEVSDSSIRYDTGIKAEIYAEAGVAEYWIVDVQARRVHVYRDSDRSLFRSIEVIDGTGGLSPRCLPSANLDLDDLFSVV